ncbi:hypothetical protein QBC39DRAFT_374753 [Podospora conica]|nr:hypothetical protein QBC39DRAFT_374753 [Schizothecium conicum]
MNTERSPFPEVEPQGHIFRSSIVFCDAASRQRVPAAVYLVPSETQELGHFVIYILGEEFCRLPLTQMYNTTTCSEGGEHQVMVMFKCDGKVLSYLLLFQTQALQVAFIKTERALRSKTGAPPTKNQTSASAATVQPSLGSPSREDGTSIIPGTVSVTLPTPSIANSPTQASATAATPASIAPDTVTSATPATLSSVTAVAVDGLINLDAEEEDQGAGRPSSSATDLLATLDPIAYEDLEIEADDQEAQAVVEPTEMIRIQYRLIQSVFRQANIDDSLSSQAVRNAFAIYLPRIFPTMDQSQLERLSDEVLNSETQQGGQRRISYSPSQIFDLRENAVDPPAYLQDLDYLPKVRHGQHRQETEPVSAFGGRYDPNGIARSAAGFSWAMGTEASAVAPTPTAINGVFTNGSSPVNACDPSDGRIRTQSTGRLAPSLCGTKPSASERYRGG